LEKGRTALTIYGGAESLLAYPACRFPNEIFLIPARKANIS